MKIPWYFYWHQQTPTVEVQQRVNKPLTSKCWENGNLKLIKETEDSYPLLQLKWCPQNQNTLLKKQANQENLHDSCFKNQIGKKEKCISSKTVTSFHPSLPPPLEKKKKQTRSARMLTEAHCKFYVSTHFRWKNSNNYIDCRGRLL